MKLQVLLTNNKKYKIDLIDHPIVHRWAKEVVNLRLRKTEHVYLAGGGKYAGNTEAKNNILTAFDHLTKVGVDVPKLFYDIVTIENNLELQNLNNIIHRWCVMTQNQTLWKYDDTITNESALEYHLGNFDDKIFNKLNGLVHILEGHYPRPGYNTFSNDTIYWDQDFYVNDYFINPINFDEIKDIITNDHYTVWIAKRIPGKDWRECYIDQDDPTQSDIVNFYKHIRHAFEIDLNDRSKFYYGEEFTKYLNKYGLEYNREKMGRIPLGNIDKNIVNDLKNERIAKLSIT